MKIGIRFRWMATIATLAVLAACGDATSPVITTDAGRDVLPVEDLASPDATTTDAPRPDAPIPEDPGAPLDADDATAPVDPGQAADAPLPDTPPPQDAQESDSWNDTAPDPDVPVADAPGDPDASEPQGTAPDGPGPHAWTTGTTTVSRGNRKTPAVVYVPNRPQDGPFPVVVFVPGFQTDSGSYRRTIERIASHGFVVVRCDPPDPLIGVDHREMAADVSAVLDWVLGTGSPAAGVADPARIAAMGHSLGGKVATMTAFLDARIGALLALDPVNGGGPSGYADSRPDIVPDQVTPLTIPMGFAGETTNGTGSLLSPACAPTDQNFQTFYEAAVNAPWVAEWTFAGADHMDFLDVEECNWTCRAACAQGSAAPEAVVAGTRTLSVAFLRHALKDEAAMLPWLVGAQVPTGVTVRSRP